MRRKIIIISLAVVVLIAAYFFSRSGGAPKRETVQAKRGEIIQEVSVTGNVKPAEEAELALEKGGRIAAITARVGDSVKRGQLLVRLRNGEVGH